MNSLYLYFLIYIVLLLNIFFYFFFIIINDVNNNILNNLIFLKVNFLCVIVSTFLLLFTFKFNFIILIKKLSHQN